MYRKKNNSLIPPYVSVAERRARAQKAIEKQRKKGEILAPVILTGNVIASSFWGLAWCQNLESYTDYENRLGRGRSYVRNGAVIDLKIEPGKVRSRVEGSSSYRIEIDIQPLKQDVWTKLCKECSGKIDSLIELVQGKLSKAVMEILTRSHVGMFPAPKDITFKCSCPDYAHMCKHVAATFYGIGARLDNQPELFFVLRQVNQADLVGQISSSTFEASPSARTLSADSLAGVFGIEMDEEVGDPVAVPPSHSIEGAPKTAKASGKKAPRSPSFPTNPTNVLSLPTASLTPATQKNSRSPSGAGKQRDIGEAKRKTPPT